MTGPTSPQIATISAVKSALAGEKECEQKVTKQKNDPATHTIKIKVESSTDGNQTVHWTERYPAKAKAVIWNFMQNSAKLVFETRFSREPFLDPCR